MHIKSPPRTFLVKELSLPDGSGPWSGPWARPGRCCLPCRLPWSISSVQSLDQDVSKVLCFLFLLTLGEESSPTLLDLLFSVNNFGGIFSNQIYEQKMSTKKTAMQTASCNCKAAQFGT